MMPTYVIHEVLATILLRALRRHAKNKQYSSMIYLRSSPISPLSAPTRILPFKLSAFPPPLKPNSSTTSSHLRLSRPLAPLVLAIKFSRGTQALQQTASLNFSISRPCISHVVSIPEACFSGYPAGSSSPAPRLTEILFCKISRLLLRPPFQGLTSRFSFRINLQT